MFPKVGLPAPDSRLPAFRAFGQGLPQTSLIISTGNGEAVYGSVCGDCRRLCSAESASTRCGRSNPCCPPLSTKGGTRWQPPVIDRGSAGLAVTVGAHPLSLSSSLDRWKSSQPHGQATSTDLTHDLTDHHWVLSIIRATIYRSDRRFDPLTHAKVCSKRQSIQPIKRSTSSMWQTRGGAFAPPIRLGPSVLNGKPRASPGFAFVF